MEPDQIDMMSTEELRCEIRRLVSNNIAMRKAIERALSDAESGNGWGPDVTVCQYLNAAIARQPKTLYQLHWRYKNGTTEMRAQREITSNDEMREFIKETIENRPLPDGATWMVCNEKSEYFVFAKSEI